MSWVLPSVLNELRLVEKCPRQKNTPSTCINWTNAFLFVLNKWKQNSIEVSYFKWSNKKISLVCGEHFYLVNIEHNEKSTKFEDITEIKFCCCCKKLLGIIL